MSHNLNPSDSPEFALPELAVISIEGADASRFLHAQTMNDVAGLAAMDWHWNGWLTPQGRLIALFALVKLSDTQFVLVTPATGVSALLEGLKRFVFRSKVSFTPMTDAVVAGSHADLPPGTRVQVSDTGMQLRWPGEGRSLRVVLAGANVATDQALAHAWALQDLRAGIPWISAADNPQWTPQQLSLERWPAFSVKKGCYPGQEIVARTHFLGKGKRQLHWVHFSAGEVPSVDAAMVRCIDHDALCVLPIDSNEHPEQIGGAAYSVRPFDPI